MSTFGGKLETVISESASAVATHRHGLSSKAEDGSQISQIGNYGQPRSKTRPCPPPSMFADDASTTI
jgi:hypothetical protein